MSLRACPWRVGTAGGSEWRRLADVPSVILVGVTGVGKSTALSGLEGTRRDLSLLPDRRELTDELIIKPLAGDAKLDREARFALTARYRADHPGGMAQALEELTVAPGVSTVVFDGLRGENEVRRAASAFPHARFVALEAPDLVRVRRLLGRADSFDRASERSASRGIAQALTAIEGIERVFTGDGIEALASLTSEGFTPEEVLAKTRIVVAERLNYDPAATRDALLEFPAQRLLLLDTSALDKHQVARRVAEWL